MSIKTRIAFLLCLSVLLSIAIFPMFAQGQGLVTCGLLGQSFCDTCDIFVLAQTVLTKLWNPFAIVIAAAMMLYGGFLMLLPSLGGGSAAMHTKGVKVLTNALVGLTIVFFAWIAVDTILKVVAGGINNLADPTPAVIFASEFGPWNKIECKRAPKRDPIALLQIPEEFRCKKDGASAVAGFDPCDASVSASLQGYWVNDQATSYNGTSVAGKCKTGVLKAHAGDITVAADTHKVPLNCAQALFITESGGDRNAMSRVGAAGLGQIMPDTARGLDRARFGSMSPAQIQAELRNNPKLNIDLSMKYFASILRGPARGDCSQAAAGYNAGPDRLKAPKAGSSCKQSQVWQCIPETRDNMVPGIQGNLAQIAGGCNPF